MTISDVGVAGALDVFHDGGKGAEGDTLVGADIDGAVGVGLLVGLEERAKVVKVDELVGAVGLEVNVLVLVDGGRRGVPR